MTTKAELLEARQRMKEIDGQLEAISMTLTSILSAAEENEGGRLNVRQQHDHDKLTADFDRLQEERKQHQQVEDQFMASYLDSDTDLSAGTGRKTRPQGLDVHVREGFESDPRGGFKSPREFLTAVLEGEQSHRLDPRLKARWSGKQKLAAGGDEASVFSDPHGGFLLPKGFSPDVLSVGVESDPTAGRVTRIAMDTKDMSIPARVDKNHSNSVSGGLRVYRRAESQSVSSSRMELEQVRLVATSLFGLTYSTQELVEQSPQGFIQLLEAGFADEFSAHLLDERLTGTGVGEFEGILNSPALVTVAKESGQAADTIQYENVVNMRARVWRYNQAIWLANHDTLPHLMLMNTDSTNGINIWQPSAREDAPDMLFGRPIFFTEFAKKVGDKGDIMCCNWTQFLEGTRGGDSIRSDESVHVRFSNHETTFKFWLENDGRSWWRSALTPKNSSDTLSPFVTLAERA